VNFAKNLKNYVYPVQPVQKIIMNINFQQLLGELDRQGVNLSLRGGKVATEPPLSPGLRNTLRLLQSEAYAYLLGGGNRAPVEPTRDNSSYRPLETEDPQTMPPDIQAAYDRGESVTFVKARGRWELYKVLEPPKDLSDEVRGLLLLFEMGELPEQVQRRLAQLFTENPTDISERLERAALFMREKVA
jgi:hypothetical protein